MNLLISRDPEKAYKIALDLEKYNTERKYIESSLTKEIFSKARNYHNNSSACPLVHFSGANSKQLTS